MKRLTILSILAAASLPMAVAQASTSAHATRAARLTLEIRHTALGNILVNGQGLTVFAFSHDSRNHDSCVTISGCTGIWPLVTANGSPKLGTGVRRSLVRTITLASGARQITYAGHPLYTYIGASGAGDTSYVGQSQFGGRWFALTASGRVVR